MPSTAVSPGRTGPHGPLPSQRHRSRWREGLGEGTEGLLGLSGCGGPGAAQQVPARLTQHVQRVQPRVLAQAVPGQARVGSGVGSSQLLEEQGAATRGHPAWGGWDSEPWVHPVGQERSVLRLRPRMRILGHIARSGHHLGPCQGDSDHPGPQGLLQGDILSALTHPRPSNSKKQHSSPCLAKRFCH